jgi:hypothetical protein
MDDSEADVKDSLKVPSPVDKYSLFVLHLDNWIVDMVDSGSALSPDLVTSKIQEALRRNADSNASHYTNLREMYKKSGDEALARRCDIVARVYRSFISSA